MHLKALMLFLLLPCLALSAPSAPTKAEIEISQLQARLAQFKEPGQERLEVLVTLVRKCWRTCPNEAVEYSQEANKLLIDFPNDQLEARMIGFLTRIYIARGDYDSAQKLTDRGIIAGKSAGNETDFSRVLFNQAVIYSNHNKYILAESIYKELLEIYTLGENTGGMASTLNNLGFMNHKLRDHGVALSYFQKAQALYESDGNKINYANTLVNIADVHLLMGNPQQSIHTAKLVLEYLQNLKAPRVRLNAHLTYAKSLTSTKQYQAAITQLQGAIVITEQYKMNPAMVDLNNRISENYVHLEQPDLAKKSNEQARALLNDKMPIKYTHQTDTEAARIAIYQQDWQKALDYLSPILEYKDPSRFLDGHSNPFIMMVELQEKLGNWKESAKLNRTYLRLYDEYVEKNRKSRAEQFAALYQKSEKERQIAELEQQNAEQQLTVFKEQENRRFILYMASIVVLILLTLVLLGIQRRKAIKMEAAMLKDNIERSKRMFSDISHELRTPLTVIKLKIEELEYKLADDPQETYEVMHEKLAGFNLLIDDISLLAKADADDLELNLTPVKVKHFFNQCATELKALAASDELTVNQHIELDETDICIMDEMRIHQVMTNLFTNSCRYTDSPGSIDLNAKRQANNLVVTISDSTPGLNNDQLDKIFERLYRADQSRSSARGGSGLGLAICKRLVALHKGNINAQNSKQGGILITLTLPLNA